MGGTITIARTQPGKGSCFRVDLPLEVVAGTGMISQMDAVQENRAAEPHLAAASLSGRILLAEDGVDNQRLIAFHLRKAGRKWRSSPMAGSRWNGWMPRRRKACRSHASDRHADA